MAAGCDYIQIEEPLTPSHAAEDRTAANMVDLINKIVDGITGCTFVVHICFGSFRRPPYPETPEDIIERVRTCLEYRDAERLEISTDCGLRRVPRYLAISKMSAAAEAARRLRATG